MVRLGTSSAWMPRRKRWLLRLHMIPIVILLILILIGQQQGRTRTTDQYTASHFPILCDAFTATTTRATATIVKANLILQQEQTSSNRFIQGNSISSTKLASTSGVVSNAKDENEILNTSKIPLSSTSITSNPNDRTVPTTLNEALRIFFGSSHYHGPRLIVLFLSILFYQRIELGPMIHMMDQPQSSILNVLEEIGIASIAMVFWWIQEHVLHQRLLHSQHLNWMGKDIHVQHHNQPYYHISIDSAPIMIGWLVVVHVLLRFGFGSILPLHLIYTATMAYGVAGLFYEWTHFIVHTKVRFSSNSFWTKVKNHHARHHLINHDNYFAFTITQIDDLFGTNPDVTKVPRLKKNGMNM